jgi:hypothetical protein
MARGFRNDEIRVREGFNERAGHGRAGLGAEVCGCEKIFREKASAGDGTDPNSTACWMN